jgi:tRNA wybutosine-synthesizing protein 3
MNNIETITFENIKKHHAQTLQDAIDNKQADKDIIPFLLEITKIKDLFTSSSCSGRIVLLSSDVTENKKYTSFHKKYHQEVNFNDFLDQVNNFNEGYLWLKVEPFILHIGVKDINKATQILSFCRNFGLKRASIISTKLGKIIVEATNTVFLSTLIKKNNVLLVSKEYLQEIIKIANQKLKDNEIKRKNFEKSFLEYFS